MSLIVGTSLKKKKEQFDVLGVQLSPKNLFLKTYILSLVVTNKL